MRSPRPSFAALALVIAFASAAVGQPTAPPLAADTTLTTTSGATFTAPQGWTVTSGAKAPKAAGTIHTDFEKGFIRAETIAYDDYVGLGGEQAAKAAGKMRLEGKEYVVRDGDVMLFRFAN